MERILLNVADIREYSRVNGPGLRSVVWVQGCTIGCPGCFNPHTHAHKPVRLVDPERLARRLFQIPDTQGITISGGEPFEQAQACAVLASAIQQAGQSVMVFSGYGIEMLRASRLSAIRQFLGAIDLLIAGPYVRSLPGDGSFWRGSTNQTVHFLTDRLRPPALPKEAPEPLVEITFDGRLARSTGFPTDDDRAWIDTLSEACPLASAPCFGEVPLTPSLSRTADQRNTNRAQSQRAEKKEQS